ncbi:uncharacterized protein LOC141904492 [Tubulanus polymorphus]|uniref:uncharacterized protein LOC141904492 n=1 Tax=Tubulanus polymorphus TaxID=672921 RepID=UPI003DA4CC74
MELIEEKLPGIEDFICRILAKEKLSVVTERKRVYYAESIETLKQSSTTSNSKPTTAAAAAAASPATVTSSSKKPQVPPSLPPRNDSKVPVRAGRASLPALSYDDPWTSPLNRNINTTPPQKSPNPSIKSHGKPQAEPTYQDYDVVKFDENGADDENFYEIPIPVEEKSGEHSDDSNTSYEPMDGECSGEPRVKKSKKTTRRSMQDFGVKSLVNAYCLGEAYYKLKNKWTKLRWCGINNARLVCYKNEKDNKPLLDIAVYGYDVTYLDKDGKRNNVIRLSFPGLETHFLSTETKDKADHWMQHLGVAATASLETDNKNTSIGSTDSGVCNTSQPCETKSPSMGYSSSDSGSCDGLVRPGGMPNSTSRDGLDGKGRKGIGAQLTEFLGTFGKKKGKKVMKMAVDLADIVNAQEADDIVISGNLNVMIPGKSTDWSKRWCLIRRNNLEVYTLNDLSQPDNNPEFSLLLSGCDIIPVDDKNDQNLTFKITDTNDRIFMEAPTMLDMSDWIRLLLKETGGCATDTDPESMEYCYIDEKFDKEETSESITDLENEYDDVYDSPFMKEKKDEKSLSLEVEEYLSAATNRLSMDVQTTRKNNNNTGGVGGDSAKHSYRFGDRNRPVFRSYTLGQRDRIMRDTPAARKAMTTERIVTRRESEPEVIHCSTGRTIDQDRDILEMTENPFLSSIRAQKKRISKVATSHEQIKEELAKLREKLSTLRQQRTQIRLQKAKAETLVEQRRLAAEFNRVDDLCKEVDCDISQFERQLTQSPYRTVSQSLDFVHVRSASVSDGEHSPHSGRKSVLERMKFDSFLTEYFLSNNECNGCHT